MQYRLSREDQRLQYASAQERDGHRYSGLPGVFFSGPICVASDGRILAVKFTESPDPPVDAIAIFDRPEMKGRHDEQVYEKSETEFFVSPAGDRAEISPEGSRDGQRRFPAWKQVIPAEDSADRRVLCVDAELLYRLAKALIPKGEQLVVTLDFTPGELFAPVLASDYLDRAGLIALVSREDDDFTAGDILRAVSEGRRLVRPTTVPVPVLPAPAPADVPDESELTFDFTDEELLNLAVALDVLNSFES